MCQGAEFYSFDDYAPPQLPHEVEPRIYSNDFRKNLPKKLHVQFMDMVQDSDKLTCPRYVIY